MKDFKLYFAKKIYSVITASSMMFGCRYVSAMKPESNSLNLEFLRLQEDCLNLMGIGMRCRSSLERDDVFFDLIERMRQDLLDRSANKYLPVKRVVLQFRVKP